MTPDINSRARQLLVDIGLKEPAGDPPEIVAQYERLVAFVAEHLRQVAAEARETTNPCNKIFDHKWLSPECVETGCKSLLLAHRAERAEELADKYKWQVRDTCTRAEKAEYALASLRALLAEAEEAAAWIDYNFENPDVSHVTFRVAATARMRGFLTSIRSGKSNPPHLDASIQSALRDASPTMGKPK